MALLIVTRSIPLHPNSGGMEEVAWELAKELSKSQVVEVLTTPLPGQSSDFMHDGIRVLTVAGTRPGRYSWKWWLRTALWSGVTAYSTVLSVSAGATSMVWMKRGPRYVFQAHGTAESELQSIFRTKPRLWLLKAARMSVWERIDRWTFLRASAVVAVSPTVANKLKSPALRQVWDRTELVVVENGVQPNMKPSLPSRQQHRAKFGFQDDDHVVVTISRLTRQKGVDQAMAGVAISHPRTKLLVVGEGPEEFALKTLAKQSTLGERVVFAGRLDRQGVKEALGAADTFLFPVRDAQREGLPIAVLEALSAGLPIVVPMDSEWHEDLLPMLVFAEVGEPKCLAIALEESVNSNKPALPPKFTTQSMAAAYARILFSE